MTKRLGIAEALREAIAEEMERDERVFCIGEDIAVPGGWGGAFTVTLGLEKRFPDRMINTPIAELGFFGVACGAAMMGLRPIADVQYGDFLLLAVDQIINNIAKMRVHVRRADHHAGGHAGADWRHRPRQPARAEPGTLFYRRARAESGRSLERLRRQGDPQGRGARRQPRDDLRAQVALRFQGRGPRAARSTPPARFPKATTLCRWIRRRSAGRARCDHPRVAADAAPRAAGGRAARRGRRRRRGDRRAQPSPLDYETIAASVRKTGRVVVVEEGPVTGSVSAEIAAGIMERCGESLRCPVRRVASADVPVPFSPPLENAYRPDASRIAEAARQLMRY